MTNASTALAPKSEKTCGKTVGNLRKKGYEGARRRKKYIRCITANVLEFRCSKTIVFERSTLFTGFSRGLNFLWGFCVGGLCDTSLGSYVPHLVLPKATGTSSGDASFSKARITINTFMRSLQLEGPQSSRRVDPVSIISANQKIGGARV